MVSIALINSGKKYFPSAQEPLNLGIMAGYLVREGIDIKIIDQVAGHNVQKEITKMNPDYVGITSTTASIFEAYDTADFCREQGFKTIMGGKHASAMPDEALNHCDCVVKDEGDIVLPEIVKNGIKTKIVEGIPLSKEDVKKMPQIDRRLFDMDYYLNNSTDPKDYINYTNKKSRIAAMVTSRGCPFRCVFCYNSTRTSTVRFYEPDYVVKEIEVLVNDYGANTIFFFDDFFFANKDRIKKICNLIIDKNLEFDWNCQIRADLLDKDVIKLAKKAGCKELNFGFESGSQRILNILKNNTTTVEQNKKAVDICKEIGILSFGNFMIGNPTETEEDIKLTEKFIKESGVDKIGVMLTTAYPGTKLWEQYKHQIDYKNINWSDFIMGEYPIHMCNLSREKLMELYLNMVNLCYTHNKEFPMKKLIYNSLRHPFKTVKSVIRNPSKLSVLKHFVK